MYTSLEADLPPKSFSETVPWKPFSAMKCFCEVALEKDSVFLLNSFDKGSWYDKIINLLKPV